MSEEKIEIEVVIHTNLFDYVGLKEVSLPTKPVKAYQLKGGSMVYVYKQSLKEQGYVHNESDSRIDSPVLPFFLGTECSLVNPS